MKKEFGQQTTKVKQLADAISQEISMGAYKIGDLLPSINQLSADYKVSRDTVFKAFLDLRERGAIDSTPGKGYYVKNKLNNVLLLLDQYSPFKDVLYNSFIKKLPAGYKVDLLFHQYNERLFKTLIRESAGRYNKYIVMNFSNEKFSNVLSKIDPNKLLLLDFGKFDKSSYSYICQDFDEGLYKSLESVLTNLKRYKKLVLVFPKDLMHPQSSKEYFEKFCTDYGFLCEIADSLDECKLQSGVAYLVIKLQDVVDIIKQSRILGLKCGKDIGVLAYNDIPSYEVIDNGITALTIDWQSMGAKAADFVIKNKQITEYLPTEVIMRSSL
ncbi:GntR family transcriptional regulator [Bacteroides sedimenti]|uniref:GntR family transcriptional regulator n=1 Tax=Bacteroides sedimenti TaxID=2136147 RepID=A0ABM8IIQ4_9BACE